ncbi:hypothetical protein ACLOJK_008027 [Asimina triloba]
MAHFLVFFSIIILKLSSHAAESQPSILSDEEQEAAYAVLESFNSAVDWRSVFPDDLCLSAPHGVVCDFFPADDGGGGGAAHISELSFGYLSDYSSNPPCGPNPRFTPRLTSLPGLRRLFFYNCFTSGNVSIPDYFWNFASPSVEELVFIENPSLVGGLRGGIGNFSRLRRLVLSGTGISGAIPDSIGKLLQLEQLVISRSGVTGAVPAALSKLRNLKILDLSYNRLDGNLPPELGSLPDLLKLDLGSNQIAGRIPDSLAGLRRLELLDLSYNRLGNFGVPTFLSEMEALKEVHLSGNQLGGRIPEIWEKMGGILGIGFSEMGLVGNIPASMGVFLKKVCYLGLDNNQLDGKVPAELGLLENVKEMNLENNRLHGEIPFSADFAARGKLKLEGNAGLCVDSEKKSGGGRRLGSFAACGTKKMAFPNAVAVDLSGGSVPKASLAWILGLALFHFN